MISTKILFIGAGFTIEGKLYRERRCYQNEFPEQLSTKALAICLDWW